MRQFVTKLDAIGRFRAPKVLLAIIVKFVDANRLAWCQNDHRSDLLSPFVVGDSDDSSIDNRFVAAKYVFDFGRGDVLATANDRVVGTAFDEEVLVFVDPAAIFGWEPALSVDDAPAFVFA
jgi:hypothetical protein